MAVWQKRFSGEKRLQAEPDQECRV